MITFMRPEPMTPSSDSKTIKEMEDAVHQEDLGIEKFDTLRKLS